MASPGRTLASMSSCAALTVARIRQILRAPRHLVVLLLFPPMALWGLSTVLPSDPAALGQALGGAPPLSVLPGAPDGPAPPPYLPAALALALVLSSFHGSATALAAERQTGILRRLRATPTPRWAPPLAMLGASAMVGLAQLGSLILAAGALPGDLALPAWRLLPATLLASMALSGAGLILGALGRTPEEVGSLSSVVGVSLLALGGAFVPITLFPPWLRNLAQGTPVQGLIASAGPSGGIRQLALLLGWTGLLLAGAAWTSFRTE